MTAWRCNQQKQNCKNSTEKTTYSLQQINWRKHNNHKRQPVRKGIYRLKGIYIVTYRPHLLSDFNKFKKWLQMEEIWILTGLFYDLIRLLLVFT